MNARNAALAGMAVGMLVASASAATKKPQIPDSVKKICVEGYDGVGFGKDLQKDMEAAAKKKGGSCFVLV
jgi:ABC-type sugar transport system substrate-binding protein